MLSQVTKQLLKTPKTSLLASIAILFLLGFLGTQLIIDPSFSSLISSEGEFNTNARMLENAFGQNGAFEIVYSIDETSTISSRPSRITPDVVEESISALRALLEESQYITQLTPTQYSDNQRQARFAAIVFQPNTPEGVLLVKAEMESYIAQTPVPTGVKVDVTGFPIILDRVSTLLIVDNLTTILITALLVFSILLWYFRSLRLALIGVLSPITSLAVLAGFMVLLNIDITLTLAAVGVIVIGLGADYSIHLITTYTRHLRQGHKPKKAILESLDELELALTASFLTTLAGFVALMLGVSPSSQAQGQVLAIAITTIFVVTMLILPLMLFVFVKKPPKGGRKTISFIDGVFAKLAWAQTHHPWRTLGVLFVVTIVMVVGATQVGFSTSNSNWIPDDDPVSLSFRELSYAFGEEESITLVVESTRGDLRSLQTVRDIQLLETKIQGIPGVTRVNSAFSSMTLDSTHIQEQSLLQEQRFNKDYTLTTISITGEGFLVDDAGNSLVLEELNDILSSTPVYHTKITPFGDIVRFAELGESLQQDAAITTLVGLILVFFVASIVYYSFIIGSVALIPIIIAVIWAVGLKGYFGVPFTSLSTGIVSLVLGIGVDFSIHLVNAIRYAQRKTDDIEQAITIALNTTGGAILLSSMTTFFGFLALTFATLLGTQRLGWSLAFSIVAVFIVTIVFVPTVIRLRAKLIERRT